MQVEFFWKNLCQCWNTWAHDVYGLACWTMQCMISSNEALDDWPNYPLPEMSNVERKKKNPQRRRLDKSNPCCCCCRRVVPGRPGGRSSATLTNYFNAQRRPTLRVLCNMCSMVRVGARAAIAAASNVHSSLGESNCCQDLPSLQLKECCSIYTLTCFASDFG